MSSYLDYTLNIALIKFNVKVYEIYVNPGISGINFVFLF